jgi:mRNA-degrading endonuclease YafQ of YafQ-DinJ toxin-antitoxin module
MGKHHETREAIRLELEQFSANPLDPELKNHKLSGQLKGLRAISAVYDCRIGASDATLDCLSVLVGA